MFNKLLISLLVWLLPIAVSACDICGCFMGITPYDNQSTISLFYRMRSFNGYNKTSQPHNVFPSGSMKTYHGTPDTAASGNLPLFSPDDFEEYRVVELRAKYFIHNKIELNVIVPYILNKTQLDHWKEKSSGIGDLNFFGGYHWLKNKPEGNWQNNLITGVGIKLPTGLFSVKNRKNQRFELLLQPGTGTVDYFMYLHYITGFKKAGAALNVSYKINGENKYDESIANSLTASLNLFYKVKPGKNTLLIPSIQAYYECTKGLKTDGVFDPGTSMNLLMAGPGLEFF